jgi:hypothetical protein
LAELKIKLEIEGLEKLKRKRCLKHGGRLEDQRGARFGGQNEERRNPRKLEVSI